MSSMMLATLIKPITTAQTERPHLCSFILAMNELEASHIESILKKIHPDTLALADGTFMNDGAVLSPEQAYTYIEALQQDQYALEIIPTAGDALQTALQLAEAGYMMTVQYN